MANNARDATSPVKKVLMDNHKSKRPKGNLLLHVQAFLTSRPLLGKPRRDSHASLWFHKYNSACKRQLFAGPSNNDPSFRFSFRGKSRDWTPAIESTLLAVLRIRANTTVLSRRRCCLTPGSPWRVCRHINNIISSAKYITAPHFSRDVLYLPTSPAILLDRVSNSTERNCSRGHARR